MFALILLTNFVVALVVTIDATVTIKASAKHKMAAGLPSGRSALINQLHDCLFYLGSVIRLRMYRKE